jgi:arsenate reductase
MKKSVLFLCTGDSCRSQMAEGLPRKMAGDRFEVYSAGVDPTRVNPLSIRVMEEIGLDISGQRSKSVDKFSEREFDHLITVCDNARQSRPFSPGKCEFLHWNPEDPAEAQGTEEERLSVFRRIRDQIKDSIVRMPSSSITA